jgi:hypothetical protein
VWYKTGDRVLVPGTGTGVCQHRVVDPSPCRVLNMCVAGWRCAQLLCPSECWQGPGACARVCVCVPTAVVSLGTDLLPQSTLCSRMWGMPVLSLTGVRNTAPKVLFSSLFTTLISWAPAQVCRQGTAGARGGGGGRCRWVCVHPQKSYTMVTSRSTNRQCACCIPTRCCPWDAHELVLCMRICSHALQTRSSLPCKDRLGSDAPAPHLSCRVCT